MLSHAKAEKFKVWRELERAFQEETPVEGVILGKVKGGLKVDIGVPAFLPGSHVDIRPARNLDRYVGQRGRNVALAEKAVTDAKAYSAKEALDGKLIDLISGSESDLLAQLNGKTITRFDGSQMTLQLGHPEIVNYGMSARERFLSRIVQPDVFFVLLIVGVLGLYAEFTHPGMVAPGVIGGICLVLALFAMHLLPVSLTGLLLILLAIALFVLEAKFAGHGILGVGGAIALILGAVMLVRSPLTAGGVGLGVAFGVALPFAVFFTVLARLNGRQFGRWRARHAWHGWRRGPAGRAAQPQ